MCFHVQGAVLHQEQDRCAGLARRRNGASKLKKEKCAKHAVRRELGPTPHACTGIIMKQINRPSRATTSSFIQLCRRKQLPLQRAVVSLLRNAAVRKALQGELSNNFLIDNIVHHYLNFFLMFFYIELQ